MSRTLLSQKLLDRAGLTEGQELWILQQCNGDYSQYEVIRRAMKRLPSLDHRHNHDANAWMTDAAAAAATAETQQQQHNHYNPFQSGGLQRPAPDPPSYSAPTESEETWLGNSEEYQESSEDDDYLS